MQILLIANSCLPQSAANNLIYGKINFFNKYFLLESRIEFLSTIIRIYWEYKNVNWDLFIIPTKARVEDKRWETFYEVFFSLHTNCEIKMQITSKTIWKVHEFALKSVRVSDIFRFYALKDTQKREWKKSAMKIKCFRCSNFSAHMLSRA